MELGNDAYDTMVYIKNTKSIIDYISLIKYNDNTIKYFGGQWTSRDLVSAIKNNYALSTPTSYGNMRVGLSKNIFGKERIDLNIYQPVYDHYELNKQIALVCITVDSASLRKFYEIHDAQMPFDTYITDADGRLFPIEMRPKYLLLVTIKRS